MSVDWGLGCSCSVRGQGEESRICQTNATVKGRRKDGTHSISFSCQTRKLQGHFQAKKGGLQHKRCTAAGSFPTKHGRQLRLNCGKVRSQLVHKITQCFVQCIGQIGSFRPHFEGGHVGVESQGAIAPSGREQGFFHKLDPVLDTRVHKAACKLGCPRRVPCTVGIQSDLSCCFSATLQDQLKMFQFFVCCLVPNFDFQSSILFWHMQCQWTSGH
mmetsp:Transcript_20393/g.44146  ORF Transcript_20393/g.44146 Transcript_20393/m.44146 type:complete len:215 (+) Transcript_20393:236-880(+)